MKKLIVLFMMLASFNCYARIGARGYYSRPRTRVIHVYHNNSGPGFGTGLLLGTMLNHNSQPSTQVVVVPQAGTQVATPTQVVVEGPAQQRGSHWFGTVVCIIVVAVVCFFLLSVL